MTYVGPNQTDFTEQAESDIVVDRYGLDTFARTYAGRKDRLVDELKKAGYTAKVRDVPLSLKKEVMKRYELPESDLSRVEIDHCVSLELGGSNDIKNLWPQFYEAPGTFGARYKDILENKLHKLVVEGDVSLKEAQHEIATDWIAAYRKYVIGE